MKILNSASLHRRHRAADVAMMVASMPKTPNRKPFLYHNDRDRIPVRVFTYRGK